MAALDGRPRLLNRHTLEQGREERCDEPGSVHNSNELKSDVEPVACSLKDPIVEEERRKLR